MSVSIEAFVADKETVRRVLAAVEDQLRLRAMGPASLERIAREFGVDDA